MKEHPILFSTEMVRAILDGKKTQTRRIITPQFKQAQELFQYQGFTYIQTELLFRGKHILNGCIKCPYGQVGDRLWVRETWCDNCTPSEDGVICYKADREHQPASDFCGDDF